MHWFSTVLVQLEFGVRKRCHLLLHLRQPWFKGLTMLNMNLICKGQTQPVSQWFGMVPCLTVYSMVLMDLFDEIHICWRCKQMLLVFPPESSFANLFLVPFYYLKTSKSDRKKSQTIINPVPKKTTCHLSYAIMFFIVCLHFLVYHRLVFNHKSGSYCTLKCVFSNNTYV